MHALLEGGAEGAVAMVAALLGQLLGDDGLMGSGKLAVAGYEVTDAKIVDVCIIACILTGEILAEIVVVHADGCRELRQGQVWLQVEPRVLTVLRQQLADMGYFTLGRGVLCFAKRHSRAFALASILLGRAGRKAVGAQVAQCLHAPWSRRYSIDNGVICSGIFSTILNKAFQKAKAESSCHSQYQCHH